MKRVLLIVAMNVCLAAVAQADDLAAEEAAIHKAVEDYVAAFNQGDAQALAALWSPEGVYTNRFSGEQVMGREAIEAQFAGIFADASDLELEATSDSIRFISPGVALEQGVASVTRPGQPPEESEYSAVYVKRDGKWLLDRVTEEDAIEAPSHYEQLKDLEWLVGHWVDQDDQATVVTDCHWTRNNNFLVRSFTVQAGDRIDMAGMQIIGWDPRSQQIRSWVFDSDGGFGEGTWGKMGDSWHIHASGTLPDGSKSTSINIISRIDDNAFTWQSVCRMAEGELLPNVDETMVVRQTEQE